jgi:hypothetical protein
MDLVRCADMIVLKARVVDSTHLELSKPIQLPRGETVLVSLTEGAEESRERQEWLAASADGLQSAYGDSEPEYTIEMVRESNTEYVP